MIRNIRFGEDERLARDLNYPLVRTATRRGWQLLCSQFRYIDTDNGEIPGLELPNVGAAIAGGRLFTAGMRIGAESSRKHEGLLTIVRYPVKSLSRYVFSVVSDRRSQELVCSRVAEILREERQKRGLSMNLVAQRAGVSQQMVSYVERGMRSPTLEMLLRIAAALQIDFVEVIRKATVKGR